MKINLYIGNHSKRYVLEDWIRMITVIFRRRTIEFKVSEQLDAASLNLILDEFSDLECSKKIINFKERHPKTLLVVIATEHVGRHFGVRAFNFCGGDIRIAAIIASLKIYYRINRNHFTTGLNLYGLFLGAIYTPLLLIDYIESVARSVRLVDNSISLDWSWKKARGLAYMVQRYLGFEAISGYIDGVMIDPMWGSSYKNYNKMVEENGKAVNIISGLFYPEFDDVDGINQNLFKEKELFFEVTGNITPYRQKEMDGIDEDINKAGLDGTFKKSKGIPPNLFLRKDTIRGAYSLHAPQSKDWPHPGLMKPFRALALDYNIPILTKSFDNYPIEDVCFVYNRSLLNDLQRFYKDKNELLKILKGKICLYMNKAIKQNNKMVDELHEMSDHIHGNIH